MNQHQQGCEQNHQQATETAALTKQDQIQLSDAEFEHLQQLVNTPPKVSERLIQAAQLLDQDGF
ncbi:type II toxin -antitoxin system TacA 1-like antitoxin [Acinetobacter brisouii]|uniref:type II toxin -antitoxin system TacA 1-like antitoxin n=1 Tax=Acinetobacter brisouii TaxID=396323 RepID=UPI0012502BB5|nr:DUF1778 domain-containing protein [Acinetobacter brisouii]